MNNKFTNRDALRKRIARENETPSEYEKRLAGNREYKQRKRERENAEEREGRLARDKERKRAKLAMETDEQREERLNNFRKRKTYLKNLNQNQNKINQINESLNLRQQRSQQKADQGNCGTDTCDMPSPAGELSKFE